jgi:dTDP-4-amino-4,6-dideoxygalactose transaminase
MSGGACGKRPEDRLLRHYERRLEEMGDTAEGAYWPNDHDRRTRFEVMLDLIEGGAEEPVVLCDLGCGTGELFAHLTHRGLGHIAYIGVDRSARALAYARAKFPHASFIELDVNAPEADLRQIACDYLVANGLFTGKFDLSYDEMWSFLVSTIERVWPHVRRGIAFNVMSKVVDWERCDLFHLPMDEAARLLHRLAGRRVRMRADYGLYEYTVYAYRPPAEGVPVLRPLLPSAERLLPYLRRLDATRIYTNHGPLSAQLERGLARHLSVPEGGVACTASGTAALVGAILAAAGRACRERPLALIPAFTFAATAAAAEACGYEPALVDVSRESWMLEPEALLAHRALARAGLVIPVSPFGRPVPQNPWREFRERTGIPVVIDGAAGFDRVSEAPQPFVGAVPLTLSFHATKAFATGEGGAVVSTEIAMVRRVVQALNFGVRRDRDPEIAGTNGKMSEYHAAVGLAELAGWEKKRSALEAVIARYRLHMEKAGLAEGLLAAPATSLAYAFYRCRDAAQAAGVMAGLARHGVDTRLWYGRGLHHQSYFATLPQDGLAATDAILPSLVGLPLAPDLPDAQIARVVAALSASLARARPSSREPETKPHRAPAAALSDRR